MELNGQNRSTYDSFFICTRLPSFKLIKKKRQRNNANNSGCSLTSHWRRWESSWVPSGGPGQTAPCRIWRKSRLYRGGSTSSRWGWGRGRGSARSDEKQQPDPRSQNSLGEFSEGHKAEKQPSTRRLLGSDLLVLLRDWSLLPWNLIWMNVCSLAGKACWDWSEQMGERAESICPS